ALLVWLPGPALPPRGILKRLALLGLLAGPVNQGLFFFGLERSTAAHAALLFALTPLGVYLLSLLQGREQASPRSLMGLFLALGGVIVLLLGRGLAEASEPLWGDLILLGSVAGWVLYST